MGLIFMHFVKDINLLHVQAYPSLHAFMNDHMDCTHGIDYPLPAHMIYNNISVVSIFPIWHTHI